MARLPSGDYLIQMLADDSVLLFEDHTERQIVRFDPNDGVAMASAIAVIDASDLDPMDKAWAHFWSGYFYAHAVLP